jgi:4-hydroxybenzoate polyprenyltransferase
MSTASALWTLARPALLPFVLALVAVGYGWAHWDRALPLHDARGIALVLLAWTALHAGTLWLNAAVDRDEGEVLFGTAVRPPPGTDYAGYAALAVGLPIAMAGDLQAGIAYLGCALLAVLYSHPRVLLKGHEVGGPLVNIVGYGLLSPLAGWAVVDVAPNPRTWVVWAECGIGVFGVYLAAQAFQQAEDRARGYRTLVATRGPQAVLRLARCSLGAAVLVGFALVAAGWVPRIAGFGVVGWWHVDRHLAAWERVPDGGTEYQARVFAARMMRLVAFGVALVFGQYAVDSFMGRPVAGLGTAAGLPPDVAPAPVQQVRLRFR